MTLLKVAMIRAEGIEQGKQGDLYLNCPCKAKPVTSIETKKDVICSCGKTYAYNGWIK